MSNWKTITEAIVRADKNSAILDAAKNLAAARSETNPLPQMIAVAVARIRSAAGAANGLDLDTAKIPNSLEWLALNLISRAVKGYLEIELTDAEKADQRSDNSYLADIVRLRLKFEMADVPAGNGEMNVSGPTMGTITSTKRDQYTREGMSGL